MKLINQTRSDWREAHDPSILVRDHKLTFHEAPGEINADWHQRHWNILQRANLTPYGGVAAGHLLFSFGWSKGVEHDTVTLYFTESSVSYLRPMRFADVVVGQVVEFPSPYVAAEFSDVLPTVDLLKELPIDWGAIRFIGVDFATEPALWGEACWQDGAWVFDATDPPGEEV